MKHKTNLTGRVFIVALTFFALCSCSFSSGFGIKNMRCEYLEEPQGVERRCPRFSWNIFSAKRDVSQSAYRVIVSDNINDMHNKTGKLWDSDITESSSTFNIEYAGETLLSGHTYYWRVCSMSDGKEVWSRVASFHTGIFSQDEWKGAWISSGEPIADASPMMRKSFEINKKVKEAYVYSSAAGIYELYLNGRKVGDDVLNPSVTDGRKTVLYSVYDVSKMLNRGGNAFGVIIGNGAYNLHSVAGRHGWASSPPLGEPRFIMQMKVVYEDGSEDMILSDSSWKYDASPITFNHYFGGEDYDPGMEQKGWSEAAFDDSAWKPVAVKEAPGGRLRWQAVPIRVTDTLRPVAETRPAEGVYLFDLGQNIAGWWKITVSGKKGQTVRVRGAETLNNTLYPKNLEEGDVLSTKFGYHKNVWTDYTLKGGDGAVEIYEPHFFYTGFRYIEVAVSDNKDLDRLEVEGRVVRSALGRNGEWTSSNELLNKIYDLSEWSIKSNTVGYPTDCPHREKGAYAGDGQVVAEASMLDFEIGQFYYKWLDDMRDAQQPSGRIPNTAPPIVGGTGGGIGWGSAYVLIPYWMYRHYDDTGVLREHYPTMKRYIEYLRELARTDSNPEEAYIVNDFGGYWESLGEWCSPDRNDCPNRPVVSSFYYYYDTRLFSEIAQRLGHTDDARRYAALCDTIKEEYNRKFFSTQTLLYGMDSIAYQPYQLMALSGGLVPEEYRAGVAKTVADDVIKRGNHLNTGIIGTKYLWPVLCDYGYDELAYSVATQTTYPSYGFWIENHSTTLLEEWGGQNSHNHQMFASILEYFYNYLAGIRMEENGYRKILLAPVMPAALEHAQATLNTMSGPVFSGWDKLKDGGYSYRAKVPANVQATLLLPLKGIKYPVLMEKNKAVWRDNSFIGKVSGIKEAAIKDGAYLKITLGSGDYHFTMSNDRAAL